MGMRSLGLFFGLWLAMAIASRGDDAFTKVHGAAFTGYIVPKSVADGWMRTYDDPHWLDDGKCWMPTTAQAIEAEKAVRDLITRSRQNAKAAFPDNPDNVLNLERKLLAEIDLKYSRYAIQFVGITVQGKKEIFCNYFCPEATRELDPSRNFIFVDDGGSCFWHIEYFLEKKSCVRLQVNGNA